MQQQGLGDVEKGTVENDDVSAFPRSVTIQDADWPGPSHERELRRYGSRGVVDTPSRMIGEFRYVIRVAFGRNRRQNAVDSCHRVAKRLVGVCGGEEEGRGEGARVT